MKILSKTIVFPLILGLGIFIGWIFNTGTPPVSSEIHAHGASEVYSCSMHPQIRQNQPGTCPLCGMNLVQSTSLQTTTDPNAIQLSEDAQKLADIQTLKVTKSSPSIALHLNGRVRPDKRKTAVQTTHISGQIEQLLIGSKGQYIKAGEIIAYRKEKCPHDEQSHRRQCHIPSPLCKEKHEHNGHHCMLQRPHR